jgi:hypothetical protein
VDTEERLSSLEAKLAAHDELIGKLIKFAGLTPGGRYILKTLGIRQ